MWLSKFLVTTAMSALGDTPCLGMPCICRLIELQPWWSWIKLRRIIWITKQRPFFSSFTFSEADEVSLCAALTVVGGGSTKAPLLSSPLGLISVRPHISETGCAGFRSDCYIFFGTEFRSCYPSWSAMASSRLTATSASWVQAILLPQPPE